MLVKMAKMIKDQLLFIVVSFQQWKRFVAYLTEEYKGAFPFWLAPVQVKILPVNVSAHMDYVMKVHQILKYKYFRVESDLRRRKTRI